MQILQQNNKIKDTTEQLKEEIKVIFIFLIIFLIVAGLIWIVTIKPECNFPTYLFANICFNFIGFIIPLIFSFVSTISLFVIILKTHYKPNWYALGVAGCWLIILILAYYNPKSPFILMKHGNSVLMPLIVIIVMYVLAYVVAKGDYCFAIPLSYLLGFLASVSTDFISSISPQIIIVGGTWGGGGIYDFDFILPIIFLFAVLLCYIIRKNRKHPALSKSH